MSGSRFTYRTRDGLGNLYLAECDIQEYRVKREGAYLGRGITAFIPASDNVNATHLTLLSMMLQGYWKQIDRLILMDNGSGRQYNWDLMKRMVNLRGEGLVIRVGQNIDHKGAMDVLCQGHYVETPYLLSLDSDLEFKQPGLIEAMLDPHEKPRVYCVGLVIPFRYFQSRGLHIEWPERKWSCCESVLSSCCMWKTGIWYEVTESETAGAWWIPKTESEGVFYDNTSRVHEMAGLLGYERIHLDFEPWVHHYGSITWGRRECNSQYGVYSERYQAISDRLRALGVPEIHLFQDPWTGGRWAGFNVDDDEPSIEVIPLEGENETEDHGG